MAGSGAYGTELRALAAELGVESRVKFLDTSKDDELPALYNVAELYVGASRVAVDHVEGFGISLVEAAATSLPVVAGREGGMPEAVVDGVTGPCSRIRTIRRRSPRRSGRLLDAPASRHSSAPKGCAWRSAGTAGSGSRAIYAQSRTRTLGARAHDRAQPLRVVHVDTERGWRGGERQAFGWRNDSCDSDIDSIMAVRPGEPLAAKSEEARASRSFRYRRSRRWTS